MTKQWDGYKLDAEEQARREEELRGMRAYAELAEEARKFRLFPSEDEERKKNKNSPSTEPRNKSEEFIISIFDISKKDYSEFEEKPRKEPRPLSYPEKIPYKLSLKSDIFELAKHFRSDVVPVTIRDAFFGHAPQPEEQMFGVWEYPEIAGKYGLSAMSGADDLGLHITANPDFSRTMGLARLQPKFQLTYRTMEEIRAIFNAFRVRRTEHLIGKEGYVITGEKPTLHSSGSQLYSLKASLHQRNLR